jgi:hypothetical protein
MKAGKDCHMENDTGEKSAKFQPIRRGGFQREKEEHLDAKPYLDFLAHYGAELVQIDRTIAIVRARTGTELPLEHKGKLQMLKVLLDEFVTVSGTNAAIVGYKTSHS